MTITPRPRYTIRRGSRAALALAVTTGFLCSSAPAAQAESLVGPAAFQNGVSSRAVDIDGLLPTFLQRHVRVDNQKRTFINPEKGKVQSIIRNSGFHNSSALFGLHRNGDITLEVSTRVDPSYAVAYYYAGVQFGCFEGVGNPQVRTVVDDNTKIVVNGKWKSKASTYPITDWLKQTAITAYKGAIAGAECGASEGPGCAELAKWAATEVPKEVVDTLDLPRVFTNYRTKDSRMELKTKVTRTFSVNVTGGQTSIVPFYFVRYSPGWNTIRITNMHLRSAGCVGPAYLRPFVVTLGRTKSGNYVNYQLIGNSYPFYPNKMFRMGF